MNRTPAGNSSLQQEKIEDDKKYESSTVWVTGESYHANRDHRTLAAAGGGLGRSMKDSRALQINADAEMLNLIDFLYENLWLKLEGEKMIMKRNLFMTHLHFQAEYIYPFTRLIWWLAFILW